ncbi:MAG: FMN-binding protein [Verrucomicrobia bacterium]|nr:FMN-binding protein [Verrucomicrobiota bacterium]
MTSTKRAGDLDYLPLANPHTRAGYLQRSMQFSRFPLAVFVALLCNCSALAEDTLELFSGARIQGTVTERSGDGVTIQTTVGTRQLTRKFPVNLIRTLSIDGKRIELRPETANSPATVSQSTDTAATTSEMIQRSPSEITALIDQLGRTPPDWFESTLLDYPNTLDLSWPEDPNLVWNYTRNVDHFLWDIINTNPKRYRGGVRLMHHLLIVNQNETGTRERVMNELGRMYFEFFKDYARSAFWWRSAGVERNTKFAQTANAAHLAECYWKLGSREMAIELLDGLPLTYAVIKLWSDLKETEKSIRLGQEGIKEGLEPSEIFVLAGDACRTVEKYAEAQQYYAKAIQVPAEGKNKEQITRNHDRAQATIEMIRLFDRLDIAQIKEGVYEDKSYGYAGNVYVEASVRDKRIQTLAITSLSDKQYYHAVDQTVQRILKQQTVKGIDAVSGATVTSEAVIRASAKALSQGIAEQ